MSAEAIEPSTAERPPSPPVTAPETNRVFADFMALPVAQMALDHLTQSDDSRNSFNSTLLDFVESKAVGARGRPPFLDEHRQPRPPLAPVARGYLAAYQRELARAHPGKVRELHSLNLNHFGGLAQGGVRRFAELAITNKVSRGFKDRFEMPVAKEDEVTELMRIKAKYALESIGYLMVAYGKAIVFLPPRPKD
jgi:hypothetical protein